MRGDLAIDIVKKTKLISNLEDDDGNTILHWVAYNDDMTCLLEWLLSGEDTAIDTQNSDGNTPLHCAFYSGNINTADMLLQYDCNISILNNAGETAFDIAELDNKTELADV